MVHDARNARLCGVFGGILFLLHAGYLLLNNVVIFIRLEGFFNPLALLSIVECVMIGVAALVERRGVLLRVAAWLLAVRNLLSMGSVLLSLVSVATTQAVFFVLLSSAVGSLASVLLAVVLLIGLRARPGADLRVLSLLPVLAQAAALILQLPLLTGTTGAEVTTAPFGMVWMAAHCLGVLLVCLWITAPQALPEENMVFQEEAFAQEDPAPFEEER